MKIRKIARNEVFVQVEGFGKYYISCYGRVYSTKTNKILSPRIDKQGYTHYSMTNDNGKQQQVLAHRLVAQEFIPNNDPNNKTEVHHKSQQKLKNNYYKNLQWVSPEEHDLLDLGVVIYLVKPNGKFIKYRSLQALVDKIGVNYQKLYFNLKKEPKLVSYNVTFHEINNFDYTDTYLIATIKNEA
ncbi:MAG: NUMOD4 motif protein [Firmicutes bacterium ADurb.Bin193]|nr:MAG: NUMOD4 motif protein [Firmicutes bacterium ADurb.Bin193]